MRRDTPPWSASRGEAPAEYEIELKSIDSFGFKLTPPWPGPGRGRGAQPAWLPNCRWRRLQRMARGGNTTKWRRRRSGWPAPAGRAGARRVNQQRASPPALPRTSPHQLRPVPPFPPLFLSPPAASTRGSASSTTRAAGGGLASTPSSTPTTATRRASTPQAQGSTAWTRSRSGCRPSSEPAEPAGWLAARPRRRSCCSELALSRGRLPAHSRRRGCCQELALLQGPFPQRSSRSPPAPTSL